MKEFSIEYDAKTRSFAVEHTNLLKSQAKELDKCLVIKPFQVGVQVSLDDAVSVSDPKAVEKSIKGVADSLATKVREEIESLGTKLQKLKKAEDAGDKKAAGEGEKETKATKKKLDKLAAEFGPELREAVEAALKSPAGKVKGRSANRSVARGLELNDDFFKEQTGGIEDIPDIGKLTKSLAARGKEISGLTNEEKGLRKELSDEIARVQAVVEKARAGKKDFDLDDFGKKNAKDVRDLETSADKYSEFIGALKDKLDDTDKTFGRFKKLIDKAEKLEERKKIDKEISDYEKALDTVSGTIPDKLSAGQSAQRLLKDDYKDGKHWQKLVAELTAIKAAAKSGGILQASGEELAKIAKG